MTRFLVWLQMTFPWSEKIIEVALIHPPHPGHQHF